MIDLRSGPAAPMAGLLAIMGLVAGLTFAQHNGLVLSDAVRWSVFLGLLVPAAWLTCLYWRRLDEAAKEAQKAAWYWGGSLGMGIGFIAVVLMTSADATVGGLLPADASPTQYVQAGAIGMMLVQLVGFVSAWALWWWSKR